MCSGLRQTMIHFLNTWLSYSSKSLNFPERQGPFTKKSMCSPRHLTVFLTAPSHALWHQGRHVTCERKRAMSTSRAVNSQFAIHPAFSPVPLALAAVAAKSPGSWSEEAWEQSCWLSNNQTHSVSKTCYKALRLEACLLSQHHLADPYWSGSQFIFKDVEKNWSKVCKAPGMR